MNISSKFILFLATAFAMCLLSSTCDKPDPDNNGKDPEETYTDIKVVDGKVRFYLTNKQDGTRKAMGILNDSFSPWKLKVNGADCELQKTDDGKWYADVTAASNETYNAVIYRNGTGWFQSSPYNNVLIPLSQFHGAAAMKYFPMYASYSKENGNKLVFNDGFALLDLSMSGNDISIVSVKVTAPGGEPVSGFGTFLPSKGAFQISDGQYAAVLNCTRDGDNVPLTGAGTPQHFAIAIAPGTYSKGLELTICDSSHRMMRHTVPAGSFAGGSVTPVEISYAPDADLVWYEGFDTFVWGGDIMKGTAGKGLAPDGAKLGIADGTTRTGTETPKTQVDYDYPGSGFIQSNTWDEVSGKNLTTSHQMSDTYIKSRNLQDWIYLFRCQEFQGVVAMALGTTTRGILCTPPISNLPATADLKCTFKVCFHPGMNDALLVEVQNGGMITEASIDGKSLGSGPESFPFTANYCSLTMPGTNVSIPSDMSEPKTWHEVELKIKNASDGTRLYVTAGSSSNGKHGMFLDDFEFRKLADGDGRKGNLRLLYWNIQNGMWADQPNNYNKFVEWVKRYDPDICVWCEAASIYKDNTNASSSSRFLPDGWPNLAARYGHKYSALSGKRDNYPQEITSKYPIRTELKITDTNVSGKPISHGAAIQEVDVNGRKLWFITCHMWPQAYGFGVATANQEASKAAHEGNYYRQWEMQYLIENTRNASKYSSQQDWILLGDMNSRSRQDNWYYNYAADDTIFLCQDVILNNTDFIDVVWKSFPGQFLSSTQGSARIDYVYVSPSMWNHVENATILFDKWTSAMKSPYVTSFYDPSDHRPILVDFQL